MLYLQLLNVFLSSRKSFAQFFKKSNKYWQKRKLFLLQNSLKGRTDFGAKPALDLDIYLFF